MDQDRKLDVADVPGLAEVDWDGIEEATSPQSASGNGGLRPEELVDGEVLEQESLEEDDDNPYGESDEALPDDRDEKVLRKDPSKEGSRFGEV